MKTAKILSFALASTTLFLSCKKEVKPLTEIKKTSKKELAIVDTPIIEEKAKKNSDYLYVTSVSGLSLRAYANLQSEKLAVMPYGTKVKVVFSEKKPTMIVGDIVGGMNEVEYNHKKGFAFNGYLSKYFPPEKRISAKRYSEELKLKHKAVKYSESKSGTVSNPIITEKLIFQIYNGMKLFIWHNNYLNFQKNLSFHL